MMLKLQAPSRIVMKDLDGGLFYRIDLARPTRNPIQDFLLENERTLSSSKILIEMHRLVRKFLKTYQGVNIPFLISRLIYQYLLYQSSVFLLYMSLISQQI